MQTNTKKRILAILLIAMFLMPLLAMPAMASFSDVAKQNTSVIFAGTDFTDAQKQKILDNFDNLPEGVGSWTSNSISTRLLSGVGGVTSNQKIRLTSNVLENVSVFDGKPAAPENPAEDGAYVGPVEDDSGDVPDDTSDEEGAPAEDKDASLIERIIAIPINGLTKALQKMQIYTMPQLFFAADEEGKPTPGMEVGGAFSMQEWNEVVNPWFTAMQGIAWLLMGITICWQGVKIAGSDSSPSLKAELQDKAGQWLLAAIFIALTPFIVQFFFDVNLAAVDAAAKSVNYGENIWEDLTESDGLLLAAIVNFIFIVMCFWYNLRYLLRKVIIMFLLIMAPLVAWSTTFQKRNEAFRLWLSEILSNIILQTAHAWVFALMLMLIGLGGVKGDPNPLAYGAWWIKLGLIGFIHPISNIMLKLIVGFFDLIGAQEDEIVNQSTGPIDGVRNVARSVIGGIAGGAGATAASKGGGSSFGGGAATTAGSQVPGLSGEGMFSMPGQPSGLSGAGAAAAQAAGRMGSSGSGIGTSGSGIGVGTPGIGAGAASVGGAGAGDTPQGYSANDSGLIVPTQSQSSAGSAQAGGSTSGGGTTPSGVQRAIDKGNRAGSVGRSVGGAAGSAVGNIPRINPSTGEVRTSPELGDIAGSVAGGAARGAATTGGVVHSLATEGAGATFGYDDESSKKEKNEAIKAGLIGTATSYLPVQQDEVQPASVDSLRFSK